MGDNRISMEASLRLTQLHAALIEARRTIKALHGPIAWDIYEKHSPEMKQIDAALKKAKT